MSKLWEQRKPPTPLTFSDCEQQQQQSTITTTTTTEANNTTTTTTTAPLKSATDFASLKIWSLRECLDVFTGSVQTLASRLETEDNVLHWDKDDDAALEFVAAAANLRSHVFGIAQKSKFEVKSMAGNIIPAIASTNAIVAGLIVLQAIKVLKGKFDECKAVYLKDKPVAGKKSIVSTDLVKPNPKCYVCAAKPELAIRLDLNKFTIKQLETRVR